MDPWSHLEFMLNNSKKCLIKNTKRAVTHRLHEDIAILATRQEKLKSMLVTEENALNEEISMDRERMKAAAIEMKRIQALNVECAAQGRRRDEAMKKLEALHRDNSENLRVQESIQKHIEAVAGMKYQIEEKHKKYVEEKELDAVWSEIMDRYYEMKFKEAEMKDKEREALKECYKMVLLEQTVQRDEIKLRELQEAIEEAQEIKKLAKEFDREEREKIEKQIARRRDLAKSKYEDLIEFRSKREKQKMDEKQLVNIYVSNQLTGTEDETEITKKKLAKLELDLHLAEVKKIRSEMKNIENHEEKLREREMEMIDWKKREEATKENVKRNALEQEIMKMRMLQLADKRGNGY